jgi:hypothetical protein
VPAGVLRRGDEGGGVRHDDRISAGRHDDSSDRGRLRDRLGACAVAPSAADTQKEAAEHDKTLFGISSA